MEKNMETTWKLGLFALVLHRSLNNYRYHFHPPLPNNRYSLMLASYLGVLVFRGVGQPLLL